MVRLTQSRIQIEIRIRRERDYRYAAVHVPNNTYTSPLNPSELQVLRAQYEKEGDMVGVQTKFNYAWVSSLPPSPMSKLTHRALHPGPRQIQQPQRATTRRPPPLRHIPPLPRTTPRMPLLPRPRKLQARQLRRSPSLQ